MPGHEELREVSFVMLTALSTGLNLIVTISCLYCTMSAPE